MIVRLTKLLLLLGFAFWGSGAAVYTHERQEAAEGLIHVEPAVVGASGAARPTKLPAGSEGRAAHHHHDHDKCPICQLLGLIKVSRIAPPAQIEAGQSFVATLILPRTCPPIVFSIPFASIRGPPMFG